LSNGYYDWVMTRILPEAAFDDNTSKARYGPAYVRAVCSQAGVKFSETSADEDRDAVDGTIDLGPATVYVQIKCSDQYRIHGGPTATWRAEQAWREHWRHKILPVYFILVVVDKVDRTKWLEHPDEGTFHRSAAFWAQVNGIGDDENVVVPKSNRFTVETLRGWQDDLEKLFAPLRR